MCLQLENCGGYFCLLIWPPPCLLLAFFSLRRDARGPEAAEGEKTMRFFDRKEGARACVSGGGYFSRTGGEKKLKALAVAAAAAASPRPPGDNLGRELEKKTRRAAN